MHSALTLGSVRLHAYRVVPGRDGEGRRLGNALRALDPRFVACEVDPAHALALQRRLAGARAKAPFLAQALLEEVARRHHGDAEDDPFLHAARFAREEGVPLLPLLPPAGRAGFLARRRLRRVLRDAPTAEDADGTLANLELTLREDAALGADRAGADAAAARRLADLVIEEGQPRVAAVLTRVRGTHILDGVKSRAPPGPRAREPLRETARAEVTGARDAYPAYR